MFGVWEDGTGGLERDKFIMRLHGVFMFVCFIAVRKQMGVSSTVGNLHSRR